MILRILMVAAAAVVAVMAVTPARAGKASEMETRISPKDLIHIPAFNKKAVTGRGRERGRKEKRGRKKGGDGVTCCLNIHALI